MKRYVLQTMHPEYGQYNNIMNPIKKLYKMIIIFLNSENGKTSEPHILLLNLADKTNLKGSDKYAAILNLSIYYILKKNLKSHTKTIN